MEQVTAFRASDGSLFGSAEACQDYEDDVLWRVRVEAFNASGLSPYPTGPHIGMTRKIIVAWERFKNEVESKEAK